MTVSSVHILHVFAGLGLVLAGCDEAPGPTTGSPDADSAKLSSTATALTGEVCGPGDNLVCLPGQCGMMPDGCRGEMWCGECACPADTMSCERSLTQIWEHVLAAGSYTIEVTQVVPATLDPVLHVITSTGSEVAFDDDSGTGNLSRLTVTVPSGQSRILVVRPKTDTPTGGIALVSINGLNFPLAMRGRLQRFTNLRAGEEIETIQLPGSSATHLLYGMSADGMHITQRASGNGTAGGALLVQSSAASQRTFWIGTVVSSPQPTHVIRNDRALSGHDAEPGGGDGLGFELERALGLCNGPFDFATGPKDSALFHCGQAVDLRDTDGDGLSDGLEVRGKATGGTHLPLRRWGANPRHKDLFAEVDGSHLSATDTAPKMSPEQARYFSDAFGDRLHPLTAMQASRHAVTLRNPDNKPGIATHFDIGVAPTSTADTTVFGSWGGYDTVPALSGGGGANPQTAWTTHLASNRRAVFRYALMWNGIGGQTSTSSTCTGCGSYAWGSSVSDNPTPPHEAGHAHGIAHSGPAGFDPFIDPNCKANWPSLENYAFQNANLGFADGTGLDTLNNPRVLEEGVLSPFDDYTANYLRSIFNYDVQNGSVDWNRDGVIAPFGTTVRAYTNFAPGNNCEFTRYNAQWLPTTLNTVLSPAFGRIGPHSYVFAGGNSLLRYEQSTSDFDCPLGIQACGSWGSGGSVSLDSTSGIDAARVRSTLGKQALLVVGVSASGVVRSTMILEDGSWSPVMIAGFADAAVGQPALETLPDGRALLVYERAGDGLAYGVFRYDGGTGGLWTDAGAVTQCDSREPLRHTSTTASPGLARTDFAGIGPEVWLLTFTNAIGFSSWNAASRCVTTAPIPRGPNSALMAMGRPVGVWVPDAANAMGGRLTILGVAYNAANTNQSLVQQMWSYVDANGLLQIGQLSGLDSGWTYGYGVDAWYDEGVDANLRAIWSASSEMGAGTGRIRFFPRADGINDFDQLNWNDWEMLSFAVCRSLVNPGGGISNPITCPDRPW